LFYGKQIQIRRNKKYPPRRKTKKFKIQDLTPLLLYYNVKIMAKIKKFFLRLKKYTKLRYCLLSFPKSGRTWLRNILAHIRAGEENKKFSLGSPEFLPFIGSEIIMNHGGATGKGDYYHFNKHFFWKKLKFRGKKIVFLIRDPRDTVVSYYYQKTYRIRQKNQKNISEFVREKNYGIEHIINFLNKWIRELKKKDKNSWIIIKYEDLKADTFREVKKILDFWGIKIEDDIIKQAIEQSSFAKMKEKEKSANPNSHKARKGKIGGYREELSKEDIKFIEEKINKNLDNFFSFYKYD